MSSVEKKTHIAQVKKSQLFYIFSFDNKNCFAMQNFIVDFLFYFCCPVCFLSLHGNDKNSFLLNETVKSTTLIIYEARTD